MAERRIAWAVTGAGHFLSACAAHVLTYPQVDIYLSRAAEEVVRMYRLQEFLRVGGARVRRETTASSPAVAGFAHGMYSVLLVAPATSNSVAKFVHGISDSLVSNLFAQAGKSRVPIVVLPTESRSRDGFYRPPRRYHQGLPEAHRSEQCEALQVFPALKLSAMLRRWLNASLPVCDGQAGRRSAGRHAHPDGARFLLRGGRDAHLGRGAHGHAVHCEI